MIILRYLIEMKAYNKTMNLEQRGEQKKKSCSKLFSQIQQNFKSKIEELHEMQELIKLMVERKYDCLYNVFHETNFKLNLDN